MATVRTNKAFKREMNTPAATKEWQQEIAREGVAAISALAPTGTGRLKSQITAERSTSDASVRFRVTTQSDAPYGLYQEVGTGIYGPLGRYITPKRSRMLSWVDSVTNERVFAKRVRGVRPVHYFKRGLEMLFGPTKVNYYGQQGGKGSVQG